MCVNFNCIFFRKSMQLDFNKNNKKLLLFQEHFKQNGARGGNRTRVISLGS